MCMATLVGTTCTGHRSESDEQKRRNAGAFRCARAFSSHLAPFIFYDVHHRGFRSRHESHLSHARTTHMSGLSRHRGRGCVASSVEESSVVRDGGAEDQQSENESAPDAP